MFKFEKCSFKKESHDSWVLTIGNFDGVHLGHQVLIASVVEEAKKLGSNAGLVTFDPHPRQVLHPDKTQHLIYTNEQKKTLIEKQKLSAAFYFKFTQAFSSLTPKAFIEDCLMAHFKIKKIIVGYNFSFGKNKSGSTTELVNILGENQIEMQIIPPYLAENEVVSSSLIRHSLLNCSFDKAALFLNRRWSIGGVITSRNSRGSQIGFPTANIQTQEVLALPLGVYACEILLDKVIYSGVMNYGFAPTFGVQTLTAEVHILNFQKDIYQKEIEIYPLRFIREEKKFESVESLVNQIKHDIVECQNIMSAI